MSAQAASEAAVAGLSAGDYINHHLHHWQVGSGFWTVNLDTIGYSLLLGIVGCFVMWRVAVRMSSGVPGRLQAAVELLVEMVDTQAKGIVRNEESRRFVAPLALVLFVWITLLNAMDLLPVDLLPSAWQAARGDHGAYMRVVPTADLSATMAMSLTVLLISLYYNVKIKGLGGWLHELFTAPFGNHVLLYPFNFMMQLIEFVAKTVSHGMRLFGNMYAGELVFLLIALMGGAFFSAVGIPLTVGHIVAGTFWAIFHILIILLQAFVFMMLALVYVGQAHDSH
ncbi:MAG: F0F1 ATP synthase subunit A [Comamonadaceae bacterium]|nr:F0F1 ATP synthase subunit A [Comamonadaceae bacterium]